MKLGKGFYRTAAICAWASVITTLCLIFLHYGFPAADSFEQRVLLFQAPIYRFYLWSYFLHPFVALVSLIGIAAKLRFRTPSLAIFGVVFYGIWAFSEMLQQALTLVAKNYGWRAAYLGTDTSAKASLSLYLNGFEAVSDALYALIVFAFALGSLLYGVAFWKGSLFEKLLAGFSFVYAVLSWLYFLGVFGWISIPSFIDNIYMAQPLNRALLGYYLWKTDAEEG
ncbi:MAG TPA: hypothetical protein VH437_05290 [Terriglobales bacterium]|jgi:hypothetical protein